MNDESARTIAIIRDFNAVFGSGDIDALMARFTDDCVFENTFPAPDGERFEGQAAVRAFWAGFFAAPERPRFDEEEIFASGDRATVRWRYTWKNDDGTSGHVRGVDVFRVRDGKVSEKLAYVKG